MKPGCIIAAYQVEQELEAVLVNIINFIPKDRICVVDDGSTDNTRHIAENMGICVISHESNRGKGAALQTGFEYMRNLSVTEIFTLDADGQHDPSYIPDFLEIMQKKKVDIVIGKRSFSITNMPLDRIFSNRTSSMILSGIVGKWISDSQCGFRLFRKSILHSLNLTTSHYEMETEILIQTLGNGATLASCPVNTIYAGANSHINKIIDTGRFLKLILKYMLKWK